MKLRQFGKALWEDWGARVTGPLSIPLTVLAFWAPTDAQRIAWAALAIISFTVAAYRIWSTERDGRDVAERLLADRQPRLAFGCDWTFGRDFAPSAVPAAKQIEAIVGADRDYYSPYYIRNDGDDTAYNVRVELPSRFAHLKFLVHSEYPPDHKPRALHIRHGQRNINYDLEDAVRDTEGVMSEILAGVRSMGEHVLRVPVAFSYADARGNIFNDRWELSFRSWSGSARSSIIHDALVVGFVGRTVKPYR